MGDPETGELNWYLPEQRGILPLNKFHVPRRLAKTIRQGQFRVTFDRCFADVMSLCAAPAPDRESSWITDDILDLYCELHQYGFAHSVEAWREDRLVGGLYGVSLGGLFAGESMFSRATDASKVTLVYLVERLRQQQFVLLDTQFITDHLEQFGCIEITANEYDRRLQQALQIKARFNPDSQV